jgi:hypothetical protein
MGAAYETWFLLLRYSFDGQARPLPSLESIALLLIVQIRLVTATLETYLAGYHETALPSASVFERFS